jgi:peptidoglycan hydrolase CwlO-like protein
VRDVLAKAIAMRNAMTDTQRQIDENRRRWTDITTEQTRIRENLKTVDRNSEYAGRLLKKLNDQESEIEKIEASMADLQKKLDGQRKELEDYLQNTNVEEKG